MTLSRSAQNLQAWKAIQAGDLARLVAHVRVDSTKYLSSALSEEEYARCLVRHLAEASGRGGELAPFTFFDLCDALQRLIGHDGGKHETTFAARPGISVPVWSAWTPQLLEFRPYDLPGLFARSSHYLHLLPSGPVVRKWEGRTDT